MGRLQALDSASSGITQLSSHYCKRVRLLGISRSRYAPYAQATLRLSRDQAPSESSSVSSLEAKLRLSRDQASSEPRSGALRVELGQQPRGEASTQPRSGALRVELGQQPRGEASLAARVAHPKHLCPDETVARRRDGVEGAPRRLEVSRGAEGA